MPRIGDRVGGMLDVAAAVSDVCWHSSGKQVTVELRVDDAYDPNPFDALDRYWVKSWETTLDPIDRDDSDS